MTSLEDFDIANDRAVVASTVAHLWQQALRDLYGAVRGHRRHQLRGTRSSGFDRLRGVHLVSEAFGQVELCEALCPDLAWGACDPVDVEDGLPRPTLQVVREAAEHDALEEFLALNKLGDVLEQAA